MSLQGPKLASLPPTTPHPSPSPSVQVRAVITTKRHGVDPFEQLTWCYNPVSTAGKACDIMMDDIVHDIPSQQQNGGATGPGLEEQGHANGASAPTGSRAPAKRDLV